MVNPFAALPFSGNDNLDAAPEVLICVKNLAEAMGSASVIGIDWTEAELADTGTFDITVTFDEAVDITSAARTANQTITNKAYISTFSSGSNRHGRGQYNGPASISLVRVQTKSRLEVLHRQMLLLDILHSTVKVLEMLVLSQVSTLMVLQQ